MGLRELLEQYALPLASFVAVLVVLAIARRRRQARRRRAAERPGGPGVALALALDGDLERSRILLERRLRLGGAAGLDALVGLMAVLRAQGDHARARAVLDRLSKRQSAPWLDAMRVRLALDEGRIAEACAVVESGRPVPVETAVAALARAGRWADALRRYRAAVPRRQRTAAMEAALAAGCAACFADRGQQRSARRALKRALALDPEGLLPMYVAARLHPKPADRHRFAERLARQMPTDGPVRHERDEVRQARQLDADGGREAAMGILRDVLDAEPRAWDARRLYTAWLVESGGADDWRAELAELVDLLAEKAAGPVGARCTDCGLIVAELFAICPRCDALGTADPTGAAGSDRRAEPSAVGTALEALGGPPTDPADGAGLG